MEFTLTRPQLDVILDIIPAKSSRDAMLHLNMEWTITELRLIATNGHCIAIHRMPATFEEPGSMAIAVGSIQTMRNAMRKKTDAVTICLGTATQQTHVDAWLNKGDASFKLTTTNMALNRYKLVIRHAITKNTRVKTNVSHNILPEYAALADRFVHAFRDSKNERYCPTLSVRIPETNAWVARDAHSMFLILGFVADVYSPVGDVSDFIED